MVVVFFQKLIFFYFVAFHSYYKCVYIYSSILPFLSGCCANTEANVEADLIQTLLTNYDINARPIINKSRPINVKIDLVLLQIINLVSKKRH